MTYTENDKLKALGIVNIFETSQPFGDYAACVVLNDGAGVSYGIDQLSARFFSSLHFASLSSIISDAVKGTRKQWHISKK